MSKKPPRSPQEKKSLSYANDRRNTYGENDKASRKNIPLRKAMESRRSRRKVAQEVTSIANLDEQSADLLESSVRHDLHRVGGWKKSADEPLGIVIAKSKAARERREGRKTEAQAGVPEADSPDALIRLAKRYRRIARQLTRALRIGRNADVLEAMGRTYLEQAQAYEARAHDIIRQRSQPGTERQLSR